MSDVGGSESIEQRVELQGSEQLIAALREIGRAGNQAFTNVDRGLGRSRTGFREWGNEVQRSAGRVGRSFNDVSTATTRMVRNLTLWTGAAVAAAVGFSRLVLGAADAAGALNNTATALGLTIGELQRLQFVAEQANVSTTEFESAMRGLTGAMGQAGRQELAFRQQRQQVNREFSRGSITLEQFNERLQSINDSVGDNITAFTRLGVRTHEVGGQLRNRRDVLLDLADAFQRLPPGMDRSTLAMEIFGSRGSEFINVLSGGADGIRAMEREAERVAPALTEIHVRLANRVDGEFKKLRSAADNTRQRLLLLFAGPTARVFEAIAERIIATRDGVLAFVQTLVDQAEPHVRDLIALIEGRDQDIQGSLIPQIRLAIIEMGRAAMTVVAAFRFIMAVLDELAAAIRATFGVELTGAQIAVALVVTKMIGGFALLRAGIMLVVNSGRLLVSLLRGVPLLMGAAGAASTVLSVAIGGVATAIRLLTMAWRASPLGLIATVIGLAAGAFVLLTQRSNEAGTSISEFASNFIAAIVGIWNDINAWIDNVVDSITSGFRSAFDNVLATIQGWYNRVVGFFSDLIAQARRVAAAVAAAFRGGEAAEASPGFARGGRVWGPGTKTSDSIPARLSAGEYVVKARAVDHYGASLLHAINSMRFDPSALVRGFADGGLALADGIGGIDVRMPESVAPSSKRALNLYIDGQQFEGLSAPDDVAERLVKFATNKKTRAAGRKPGWYGGRP